MVKTSFVLYMFLMRNEFRLWYNVDSRLVRGTSRARVLRNALGEHKWVTQETDGRRHESPLGRVNPGADEQVLAADPE